MLYMVIERFKEGRAGTVYRRFRERGRLMPEGLAYVDSWVELDLGRCFQLVETDDPALLEVWTAAWTDLVAYEVCPVVTSEEAAVMVAAAEDEAGEGVAR